MTKAFCSIAVIGALCTYLTFSACSNQDAPRSPQEFVGQPSISSEASIPQIVQTPPNPLDLPAETALSDEMLEAYGEDSCFGVFEISDELFERMHGRTYKDECAVSRDDLRYVRVLHVNEEGKILTGEIVVNVAIADEVCEIFRELYEAHYPIERMRLADDYEADDIASMEDNNSSGFNYRPIEGTSRPSKHALGLAIDINTFYNPYYRYSDDFVSPEASAQYLDRSKDFPYKIEEGDLCYRLFTEHGYTWGGHWKSVKDYQHFEK